MNNFYTKKILISLGLPGLVFLIFYTLQPSRFGDIRCISMIFQQSILYSVMAWGLFFILTQGLWDFSLGGIMILSSIIGAVIGLIGNSISPILGYILMFVITIFIAAILCFFNGFVFVNLKIPSIVVTIGLLLIYEVAATMIPGTSGTGISLYKKLSLFGKAPFNILLVLFSMLLAYYLYNNTIIGIHARAIGSNVLIARNMGVKTEKITKLSFLVAGIFVGISGILTLSFTSIMVPQTSLASLERIFTPVMGCMVGMIFKKYLNPIIGILIGEFTITIIITGLMACSVDATIQKVVIGSFLLIISSVSSSLIKSKEEQTK